MAQDQIKNDFKINVQTFFFLSFIISTTTGNFSLITCLFCPQSSKMSWVPLPSSVPIPVSSLLPTSRSLQPIIPSRCHTRLPNFLLLIMNNNLSHIYFILYSRQSAKVYFYITKSPVKEIYKTTRRWIITFLCNVGAAEFISFF